MKSDHIAKIAQELVTRAGSRNPFEIAKMLDLHVKQCENFGKLKGMYSLIEGVEFIMLNNMLDEKTMRIVCAHEIGHAVLHKHICEAQTFKETDIFDLSSRYEHEANIVAATILIDSDELLDYCYNYEYTVPQIAELMNTDANLVALKIKQLQDEGHDLRGFEHNSTFLQ